jgi:hypothetical protein
MKQRIHVRLKLHDGSRSFKIGNVYLGQEGLIVIAEIIPTYSNVNAIMEPSGFVTVETHHSKILSHKVYIINSGQSIPKRLLADNQYEFTSIDTITDISTLTLLQKLTQDLPAQAKVSAGSQLFAEGNQSHPHSSDLRQNDAAESIPTYCSSPRC